MVSETTSSSILRWTTVAILVRIIGVILAVFAVGALMSVQYYFTGDYGKPSRLPHTGSDFRLAYRNQNITEHVKIIKPQALGLSEEYVVLLVDNQTCPSLSYLTVDYKGVKVERYWANPMPGGTLIIWNPKDLNIIQDSLWNFDRLNPQTSTTVQDDDSTVKSDY